MLHTLTIIQPSVGPRPGATSTYRQLIVQAIGTGYDPRHIEAYMRSEHGTPDRLSGREFVAEAEAAVACINDGGGAMAEKLAASYGL